MNGRPLVLEFRRPAPAGWGVFVLVFIPLAVFFPLLIWPLLLSLSFFLGDGPLRSAIAAPSARPGLTGRGFFSFRAPPQA
jgi:hypothetical protein